MTGYSIYFIILLLHLINEYKEIEFPLIKSDEMFSIMDLNELFTVIGAILILLENMVIKLVLENQQSQMFRQVLNIVQVVLMVTELIKQ